MGLFIINNVFLPEVLAGDVPAEVPGDALGADKSEYLGVFVIRELEVPGQKSHRRGVTRFLKLKVQAQGPQVGPFHRHYQKSRKYQWYERCLLPY